MTQTKLLIGSLSNDLYRVAGLMQRGSFKAAETFWRQSRRWIDDLKTAEVSDYIHKIITDLDNLGRKDKLNMAEAEKCLMYSILLQNYALHLE